MYLFICFNTDLNLFAVAHLVRENGPYSGWTWNKLSIDTSLREYGSRSIYTVSVISNMLRMIRNWDIVYMFSNFWSQWDAAY